ncbi:hypothetical protein GF325_03115 [Candidatus Bathyarchaeota archaeon]|nr:hypothetical protein [Candidatus Bathyarchaeota archaeon]
MASLIKRLNLPWFVALLALITINIVLSLLTSGSAEYIVNDNDRWREFTGEIIMWFQDADHALDPGFSNYNHAFTPLYPVMGAILGFPFNDAGVGLSITSAIFTTLSMVVLGLFLKEHYNFDLNKIVKFLAFFMTNYFMIIYIAVPTETEQAIMFCTIFNLYTLQRHEKDPSIKNKLLLSLSYGLSLYCREILWPMLLFPVIFIMWEILLQRKENGIFTKENAIRVIEIFAFSTLVPLGGYLPFVFGANQLELITTRFNILTGYGKSIIELITHGLIAFGFTFIIPVFIMLDDVSRKLDNKETQNKVFFNSDHRMLITWLAFFIGYRLISPGPFWKRYWIPIIFGIFIIDFMLMDRLLEGRKSKSFATWVMVAANYTFNVIFVMMQILHGATFETLADDLLLVAGVFLGTFWLPPVAIFLYDFQYTREDGTSGFGWFIAIIISCWAGLALYLDRTSKEMNKTKQPQQGSRISHQVDDGS